MKTPAPMKGNFINKGRSAEVFQFGKGRVFKLFFRDIPLRQIELEARTGQLVYNAGAPVPKVYDIVSSAGRYGIVYQQVAGETMLECLQKQPWRMPKMALMLAEIHFDLHQITVPELDSQSSCLKKQIQTAPRLEPALRRRLLGKLKLMQSEVRALCHGDFHPDNIILTEDGPVVIDWMTATAGDPIADVARSRLLLGIGQPERQQNRLQELLVETGRRFFLSRYLAHYCRLARVKKELLADWQPIVAAARLSEGIQREDKALREKIVFSDD